MARTGLKWQESVRTNDFNVVSHSLTLTHYYSLFPLYFSFFPHSLSFTAYFPFFPFSISLSFTLSLSLYLSLSLSLSYSLSLLLSLSLSLLLSLSLSSSLSLSLSLSLPPFPSLYLSLPVSPNSSSGSVECSEHMRGSSRSLEAEGGGQESGLQTSSSQVSSVRRMCC